MSEFTARSVMMAIVGSMLAACGATPGTEPTPTIAPAPTAEPTATLVATAVAPPTMTVTPTAAATAARLVVTVAGCRFAVDIADDAGERERGLAERESIEADAGMWFDLGVEREARFWMRGMLIPIDMVWVDQAMVVVGVTHDAPVPMPGTAAVDLPLYGPGEPVRFVLEINAGLARELGIARGAKVSLASF